MKAPIQVVGSRRAAITARYPEPPRYRLSYRHPIPVQPACYDPEVKEPVRSLPKLKVRQRWPQAWRRIG